MVDPILDDLKDFRFDPFRKRRSSRWWLVLGSLLVVLFFSLVLLEYPLGDIFQGKLESKKLVANTIVADDVVIHVDESVRVWLQSLFLSFQDREFSVCLLGTIEDEEYVIASGYQPRVIDAGVDHVVFSSCNEQTLIMLHSHPLNHCLASAQDIRTLRDSQRLNPSMVMVVMCNRERFSVYR
ncbi:MAG: hypothetical protein Q7R56_00160 [Nanoarchaeota archaeon]|nr:hypothetical protein [Nanoarchaeota archaeon]